MSCFGGTAAGSDRPADFKTALKSIDIERKRVELLSNAILLQREYISQLEDAAMCLEKTLSAWPESDFQLLLISGLRKKQRKKFDTRMRKNKIEENLFHADPTGQNQVTAHKRASFAERARKRASALFNQHSEGKEAILGRAEERAAKQRERLERRLQARLDEARKMELKGKSPTPVLKQAVIKLTKQILAFKSYNKDHVFEKKIEHKAGEKSSIIESGERALQARNKTDTELAASGLFDSKASPEGSLMIPRIVEKAKEFGINMPNTIRRKSLDAFDDKFKAGAESPYVQLARVFLESNENLVHMGSLLTDDQLGTWVADCNLLLLIVIDHMVELHGPLPEQTLKLISNMFADIKWTFYHGHHGPEPKGDESKDSHAHYRNAMTENLKKYRPLSCVEYQEWCGKCMDILHKKFQEKKVIALSGAQIVDRNSKTAVEISTETPKLKSDSNKPMSRDEKTEEPENGQDAFTAFKKSRSQFDLNAAQNRETDSSQRPLFAQRADARKRAEAASAEAASLLYGDTPSDLEETLETADNDKSSEDASFSGDEKAAGQRKQPKKVLSSNTIRRHSEAEDLLYGSHQAGGEQIPQTKETKGSLSYSLGSRLRKLMQKKYKRKKKFQAMWDSVSTNGHLNMKHAKIFCAKELEIADLEDEVFFPIWLAMIGGSQAMLHRATADLTKETFRIWCMGENNTPVVDNE